MSALVIAIGNPLRGDDGAASRVLELLGGRTGFSSHAVLQLTPEMAEGIAPHDTVVFVDADVSVSEPRLEAVSSMPCPSTLTHVARPVEIVALARSLFNFSGRAYICRVPVSDFSEPQKLSRRTEKSALQAVCEIERLLA
jgi:Ni,Fe-hydrogenase maturation factor